MAVQTRSDLIPRLASPRIREALADTRVVLVTGPRQSGKTTLVRTFEDATRPYFTLDDAATLASARSDPVGFVRTLDGAIIDEIQRAPDLILAIKASVDRDERPGRFLLTGSANLATVPTVADSLAGRMAIVPLLPLAQAEVEGTAGDFLDRLFAGAPLAGAGADETGEALVERVLRGGYPEVLRRPTSSRRQAWLEDYVGQILDRDVRDVSQIEQLDRLPRLLQVLAEHAAQLVNHSSYGAALGLSNVTASRYVAVLERLYLVRTLMPWSTNQLNRLVKSPKLHFVDTGLLGAMRGMEAPIDPADRGRFGPVLESFVVSELVKLASWSAGRIAFSHFRTRDQDEVDLVLEDRRGRVVGIEVKASATIRAEDFRGLRRLAQAAGDRFLRGVVLYDHDLSLPFGDGFEAVPLSALWAP